MLFNHLKAHADDSVYKFLRSTDNGAAFKVMVSEFLVGHGEEYWGLSNREHLAEPDVSKGFFYPRDANRGGSRFVHLLGDPSISSEPSSGFLMLWGTCSTTEQRLVFITW